MSKQTEALKLIDLLVKQDILTKHETNLLREALAQSRSDEEQPAQQDIPKIGCVNHDCDKCKAQQQEPYAWMAIGGTIWRHKTTQDDVPLYTTLPHKPWVGLTVDELESGSQIEKAKSGAAIDLSTAFWAGARWAEAKLREKNNG